MRVNIDAAVEGTIMSKMPGDARDIFQEMANTQSLWTNKRAISKKGGLIKVDVLTIVNAKLDALTKMDNMSINVISLSSLCELYQGRHSTLECQLMQNLSMDNYVSNFNNG